MQWVASGLGHNGMAAGMGRPAHAGRRQPVPAPASVGTTLDMLGALGAQGSGDAVYYDAPSAVFAQPALDAVLQDLGMQWIEDQVAQSYREQAAHLRLRDYATGPAGIARRWRQAAALLTAAVAAGLGGGLNFGAFALVVAQVQAAMNRSPAGFGLVPAAPFTASAAGRQVLCNLLGAMPGSLAYGVCSTVSATVLRPLVDAVALLLSCGAVTPMVPVDPAIVYPTPSPLDSRGLPKNGALYTAELEANTRQRAQLARRQGAMTDMAHAFNLKYGTPLFAVSHGIRVMVLVSLLLRGRTVAACTGAGLSGLSSALANAALHFVGGLERMHATENGLPLFVPRGDLRRIRGACEPSPCGAARQEFVLAGKAHVQHAGLARKLLLGVPAAALGVLLSTSFINVMVPFGNLLATVVGGHPAGAVAVAGVTAVAAFTMSYLGVCKTVSRAASAVRKDPHAGRQLQLTTAFEVSLRRFAAPGTREQACDAFDEMDRQTLAALRAAAATGANRRLGPGADARLERAWTAAAAEARLALFGRAAGHPALPEPAQIPTWVTSLVFR